MENSINENAFFNEKDLYINFDKWKPGKNNILYITGLSGSGKTTLAKKYENKYNAEIFEIDGIEYDYDSSKSDLLKKAKLKYPEYNKILKNRNVSKNIWHSQIKKVLLYIIDLMKQNKNKLYILEGVQIFKILDANDIKNKPIIIKGSSMTKSILQRFKRNGNGKINWIGELQNEFPQLVEWYIDSEKNLSKFKKSIKENNIEERGYNMENHRIIEENNIILNESSKKLTAALFVSLFVLDPLCSYAYALGKTVKFIIDKRKDKLKTTSFKKRPRAGLYKVQSTSDLYKNNCSKGQMQQFLKENGCKIVTDKDTEYMEAALSVGVSLKKKHPDIGVRYGINSLTDPYDKTKYKVLWIDDDYSTFLVAILGKKNKETYIIPFFSRGNFDNVIISKTKSHPGYVDENKPINEEYITEVTKNQRKYKCPYCNFRNTRIELVSHVENEHEEMIPEGYTPARVVFNSINKKDHGTCIMCKNETKWDESRWKYERICSKKCHDDYVKMVRGRMKKVYGKENLLNDPKHQQKMLANRSISGTYKFTDGGIKNYCGSYEKKLLEFFDKVLDVESKDILSPGPIIEYEYKGKKHKWITDQYYFTANLVFDVKDGGDNPNTREMNEYREKQIAKEYAIKKQGKYNYIRLTNNNFEQLLHILAELKYQMIDPDSDKETKIVRINELQCPITGIELNDAVITNNLVQNTFLDSPKKDNIFIVKDNETNDTYLSLDKYLTNLYGIKDKKLNKLKSKFFENCTIYKYTGNDIESKLDIILSETDDIELGGSEYFYNKLTGKDLISEDQYYFDEAFNISMDGYKEQIIAKDIIESTLKYEYDNILNETKPIDILSDRDINKVNKIIREYTNVNILQDIQGYYAVNIINNNRTKYYNEIDNIDKDTLKILNLKG